MGRTVAFASGVAVACLTITCAHADAVAAGKSGHDHFTPQARLAAIRRAQVWSPTNVPAMNMKAGPQVPGSYAPESAVECEYRNKKLSGNSPKFVCAVDASTELKVKYGADNGEVYAEVAATRLLWALGFPADAMYPVTVDCRGCPPDPRTSAAGQSDHRLVNPAAIELRMGGASIEVRSESGWAWPELDLVDPAAGGAPLAQRDALKLLAVVLQHSDSKPEQQRIVCPPEHTRENEECAKPVMMVNDLGQTFGRANTFNRNPLSSVNFERWAGTTVWTDAPDCVGNLPRSHTGTLDKPRISDAGRRFLGDLLGQLTDAQLHDLFEVARFPRRHTDSVRAATVSEWVDAFKRKRSEIVNRTCPS
jgi:hypothetical protein